MKTKFLLSFIIAVVLSSCKYPEYLASVENIDVNPHGAMIIAYINNSIRQVRGELIACDREKLIVLTDSIHAKNEGREIVKLSWHEVRKFRLQFAKPKNYVWSMPVYTLATVSHGFFAVFTAPANLAATITVNNSGIQAFSYDKGEISIEDISMFARYPQGIPPGIDTVSIR